jgi:hypothetical protein
MQITLTERIKQAYDRTELDDLWTLLRNKFRTSPRAYKPIGLSQVPFDIPLTRFREDCEIKMQDHVPWVDEVIITFSINDFLNSLGKKRVISYGLSCAANFKSATNTAVSIYSASYKSEGGHKYCTIFPGVNYVPSKRAIESLKKAWRMDDSEYEKWIEMYERFKSEA